jgi:hypothetical protein
MEQNNNQNQPTPDSRLSFTGSLLHHATLNNEEALKIIFKQFLPADETITHAEYYGYFGFWFVGFHSFSCLTDKRIAALRVGPFKKITYEDGFYENMTSGGIYQPSKFWLYVFLVIGLLGGFALFTIVIGFILNFLLVNIFGLFELSGGSEIFIFSGIVSIFLIPFIGSFITMAFYRANPCGLACWVRERYPVYVFVNREKMTRANKLYRLWSSLREERNKYIKGKYK